MPVVAAKHDCEDDDEEGMLIVFPRKDDAAPGGWVWDEVEPAASDIDGFGLLTKQSESLDWTALGDRTVYIPLLGRETEVGSAEESNLCVRILQGGFEVLASEQMAAPPAESMWATDGLYVEDQPVAELPADWRPLEPNELLLRVDMGMDDDAFLLKDAAAKLLQMPDHVFEVLAAHRRQHHNDRYFSTHVVAYRRAHGSHMLVNAHPIYADAAVRMLFFFCAPPPGS